MPKYHVRGPPPPVTEKKKCTYTKSGRCRIHGAGAIQKTISSSTNVIGQDGKIVVVKGKKNIFVCDISKDKRKQTQTVTKTTASLNIPQSSEDNCPDITIKTTQGDITRDKKKLKQTMISFKKTTSSLKTTPLVEDNPLDISFDTVQQGERFSDMKRYTPSMGDNNNAV